jgi:multimeric flavodoxin WrbA
MHHDVTRRRFFGFAGSALAIGASAAVLGAGQDARPIKILAISGSQRKGKTTATALSVCLEAAKAVDPAHIEVELIELAGLKIPGEPAADLPLEPGQKDDFPQLAPKLTDPNVAGILVGSPVYFGDMSSLCKAFFERWRPFRKDFAMSNKVGGALAVGSARNGGQENVLRSIQLAMFGQEMILVGDGRPTSHSGATLWNNYKDDILKDEPGIATAKNLGRRVAEVARLIRRAQDLAR